MKRSELFEDVLGRLQAARRRRAMQMRIIEGLMWTVLAIAAWMAFSF